MLILDITVVNIALPHIQRDLHMSPSNLAWVVDGYVLAAGGFLLLGGRLADLLGRRKVFLLGVATFGLASAACGASLLAEQQGMNGGAALVVARFVQGLGEAMAAPASLGLIALLFPDPQERIKALGIFGGIAGLGGTSGTVISGFVVELADWPWIFYINVPIALIALMVVPRLVAESKSEAQHRLDAAGAFIGTAGLLAIVYGLIEAARHSWGSAHVVVPLGIGLALVALTIFVEARANDPLIPLKFFSNRTRSATNFVTLFFSSAFFSYFFLLTLFEQNVLGWTPIHSGLSYLPFGFSIGTGIALGTTLMPRLGVKRLLSASFAVSAVGLALTASITADTNYWTQIFPGMVILGLGSGVSFPAIGNAALHEVTSENSSLAGGVQQAVQQIGGALGLATLATIALRHARDAIAAGTDPGVAFTKGAVLAYWIGTALLAVGAVVVYALLDKNVLAVPRDAAAEIEVEPEPEPEPI